MVDVNDRFNRLVQDVRDAPNGEGNNTLAQASIMAGIMVRNGQVSRYRAETDLMMAAWVAHLNEAHILPTITQGIELGLGAA